MIARTIAALAAATPLALAGPLTPPAGPPADTSPSLDDVNNAINNVLDTLTGAPIPLPMVPGDADSEHVITQPGRYILDDDLVVPGGKSGVRIESDCVELLLGGHTIKDGGGAEALVEVLLGPPIVLPTPGVKVADGVLDGGERAIDAPNTPVIAEHLKLVDQAIEALRVGPDSEVRDTDIFDSGGNGITANERLVTEAVRVARATLDGINAGPGAEIRDTEIIDPGGNGATLGDESLVTDTGVTNCTGTGLDVGAHSTVRDTRVDTAATGITTGNNSLVTEVGVTNCTGTGIDVAQGSTVHNSTVTGATDGVATGDSSLVIRTIATQCTGRAIVLGNASRAQDCEARDSDVGIDAADACTLQSNSVLGCINVGIALGSDGSASDNVVRFVPAGNGIQLGQSNTVERCLVIGAAGDAIGPMGQGNIIQHNTCRDSNVGFQMTPGSYYYNNQCFGNANNIIPNPAAAYGPIVPITGAGDLGLIPQTQHPLANFQD